MANISKPDPKKIEGTAINAVRGLIQKCDTLHHDLDENDKHPVIDGYIEIYSSSPQKNENLIGEIPVQVKGTTGKLKPNKRGFIKYSMKLVDLQRFLDVFHGVLLFCVAVEKDGLTAKRVYYSALLPYELKQIIAEAGDHGKTSVPVKPFPAEPREIKRLINQFHRDHEEQQRVKVSGYGFLDKNTELPSDIVSLSLSSQLYPGESPVSLAGWRNGAYVYGTTKTGEAVVFGKLDNVKMFGINSVRTVSSGDFEVKTDVVSGECEDGYYLEFEGVRMVMNGRKAKVNYTISRGFRRRYRTIRIMEEFLRTGELYLDGHRLLSAGPDDTKTEEEDKEAIEKLEEQEKAYGPFIETINAIGLGADVDWDPSKLSAKEFRSLETLHQVFVEKKPLKNAAIEPPLVRFEIQGTNVFAIVHQRDDSAFDFIDLMSDETFFVFGTPSERAENPDLGFDPVPAAVVIGEKGFKTIANLNPARFLDQLERYPVTGGNQEPLNQKLLEMLTAYDEGAVQPHELLACATALASSLHEFDPESSTYYINLLQTTMRKRALKDEEKEELKNLVVDTPDNKTKAAACALLGDIDMANRYLDKCTPMERKELMDFPIGRYFKEEEDHTADNPVLPEE